MSKLTYGDMLAALCASEISDRGGFAAPIAAEMATTFQPELLRLWQDADARCWLCVWPSPPGIPALFDHCVCRTDAQRDAALRQFGGDAVQVFDLREMFERAVITIMEAMKLEREGMS